MGDKINSSSKLQELINKADDIFIRIRKRQKSKPIYEKALDIAIKGNKEFEKEYIKGKLFLIDKDPSEALKHLNKATEIDKNNLMAWNYKGVTLDDLERYNEAIECYERAIGIDKKFFLAWNNKGVAFDSLASKEKDLELYKKAIECYNEIIKYESTDIEELLASDLLASVLSNKGEALNSLGKHEKAFNYFNEALDLNPNYIKAWNYKGQSLCELKRYNEAVECYDEAIKYDSTYIWLWINKGLALNSKGYYSDALKCFDKALYLKDHDIDANNAAKKNRISSLIYLGKAKKDDVQKLYSLEISEVEKREDSPEKALKISELEFQRDIMLNLVNKYHCILNKKSRNEDEINNFLEPRKNSLGTNFISILRRWNSYTPAMITHIDLNNGGGYFVHLDGKGIVIDPGFDFLENFFENGFLIDDIDMVIITHAHIDHCVDFEPILTLLYEYNENLEMKKQIFDRKSPNNLNKDIKELEIEEFKIEKRNKKLDYQKKKIDIFLNSGAIKKFIGWLPLDEKGKNAKIGHIYPLEKFLKYYITPNLELHVTESIHNEIIAESYSVGLIFKLNLTEEDEKFKIGFTSDTRYDERIINQYENVDVIIPHLGSVDEHDFNLLSKKLDPNHLKLKGLISLLSRSNAKLAIVSEFGEELEENRSHLCKSIDLIMKSQKEGKRCLTGDIGLKVQIPELKIKCVKCGKWIDLDNLKEDIRKSESKSIIHKCENRCMLNIHIASLEELKSVLGVSKNIAREIINLRIQEETLNEEKLANINGIGPKTIEKAKKYISFEIHDK